jgi:hypothetical protein
MWKAQHMDGVREINELYKLGADSFIQKPATEAELAGLLDHFPEPWELESEPVAGR